MLEYHYAVSYEDTVQESAIYAEADATDKISNLIADSPSVQPRHAEESATNSQYKPYSKILPYQNASLVKTNVRRLLERNRKRMYGILLLFY